MRTDVPLGVVLYCDSRTRFPSIWMELSSFSFSPWLRKFRITESESSSLPYVAAMNVRYLAVLLMNMQYSPYSFNSLVSLISFRSNFPHTWGKMVARLYCMKLMSTIRTFYGTNKFQQFFVHFSSEYDVYGSPQFIVFHVNWKALKTINLLQNQRVNSKLQIPAMKLNRRPKRFLRFLYSSVRMRNLTRPMVLVQYALARNPAFSSLASLRSSLARFFDSTVLPCIFASPDFQTFRLDPNYALEPIGGILLEPFILHVSYFLPSVLVLPHLGA